MSMAVLHGLCVSSLGLGKRGGRSRVEEHG